MGRSKKNTVAEQVEFAKLLPRSGTDVLFESKKGQQYRVDATVWNKLGDVKAPATLQVTYDRAKCASDVIPVVSVEGVRIESVKFPTTEGT